MLDRNHLVFLNLALEKDAILLVALKIVLRLHRVEHQILSDIVLELSLV